MREPHQLVADLNAVLGPTLVAALAGASDVKDALLWANQERRVDLSQLKRLQTAHAVLWRFDDGRTAFLWFVGINPLLGDDSPVNALRDDRHNDVLVAATNYFADGHAG